MASNLRISTVFLLHTFINKVVITAVPDREYYSMLTALRFRGYHLFANAISTTDLHSDIINGNNFSFFAPIDSALYALDMNISAADYTTALRFHGVLNHRLSLQDLQMLRYGSIPFDTLVPGYQIHILNLIRFQLPITVEGVNIALPGLYYGTHIVVHGLESIIDFRSMIDSKNLSSNLKNNHRRVAHAPSSRIEDPVAVTPSRSTIVTGIASPVPSSAVSLSHRQPETYFESTTHPREEHLSIGNGTDEFPQVN